MLQNLIDWVSNTEFYTSYGMYGRKPFFKMDIGNIRVNK